MEQAPVLIMVWNTGERGWETELESVTAAIQNILLKAHSLGLGTLWVGDIYYSINALTRHLEKPWRLVAAKALGWPASTPKAPPRMTVDEVTELLS